MRNKQSLQRSFDTHLILSFVLLGAALDLDRRTKSQFPFSVPLSDINCQRIC